MVFTCTVGQDCGSDESEMSRSIQRDLWAALKARKDSIETELKLKLEKLKELCLKEAVSRILCHSILTLPAAVAFICI